MQGHARTGGPPHGDTRPPSLAIGRAAASQHTYESRQRQGRADEEEGHPPSSGERDDAEGGDDGGDGGDGDNDGGETAEARGRMAARAPLSPSSASSAAHTVDDADDVDALPRPAVASDGHRARADGARRAKAVGKGGRGRRSQAETLAAGAVLLLVAAALVAMSMFIAAPASEPWQARAVTLIDRVRITNGGGSGRVSASGARHVPLANVLARNVDGGGGGGGVDVDRLHEAAAAPPTQQKRRRRRQRQSRPGHAGAQRPPLKQRWFRPLPDDEIESALRSVDEAYNASVAAAAVDPPFMWGTHEIIEAIAEEEHLQLQPRREGNNVDGVLMRMHGHTQGDHAPRPKPVTIKDTKGVPTGPPGPGPGPGPGPARGGRESGQAARPRHPLMRRPPAGPRPP